MKKTSGETLEVKYKIKTDSGEVHYLFRKQPEGHYRVTIRDSSGNYRGGFTDSPGAYMNAQDVPYNKEAKLVHPRSNS